MSEDRPRWGLNVQDEDAIWDAVSPDGTNMERHERVCRTVAEMLDVRSAENARLCKELKEAAGMTPEDWREMRKHGAHCDNILTDAELDARGTA